MPEFGALIFSVHGFLFTVTNKLPNKSLPDLMFTYSLHILGSTDETHWELYGTLKFVIVLDQVDCKCDNYIKTRSFSRKGQA